MLLGQEKGFDPLKWDTVQCPFEYEHELTMTDQLRLKAVRHVWTLFSLSISLNF